MKASPNLTKIPGNIMPIAEPENHIKDLTKLSKLELLDLKHREKSLLANERQLNKLPDKGARIKQLYEKILSEEARRASMEEATTLFSNLNIAQRGTSQLTEMEWKNGNVNMEAVNEIRNVTEDSDDDNDDVKILKMIAHRSQNEKEKSVVVDSELIELDLSKCFEKVMSNALKPHNEIDLHSSHLIEKSDQLTANKREKFKPFKTTINNTHDPVKEMCRKTKKNWENTAATPPLIKHKGTQMVSLIDSVKIQNDYMLRMKELQAEQATERLKLRNSRLSEREKLHPVKSSILFSKYRDIEGHLKAEEKDNEDYLAEEDSGTNVVNYSYSA